MLLLAHRRRRRRGRLPDGGGPHEQRPAALDLLLRHLMEHLLEHVVLRRRRVRLRAELGDGRVDGGQQRAQAY